jgi:hypothetical protein
MAEQDAKQAAEAARRKAKEEGNDEDDNIRMSRHTHITHIKTIPKCI